MLPVPYAALVTVLWLNYSLFVFQQFGMLTRGASVNGWLRLILAVISCNYLTSKGRFSMMQTDTKPTKSSYHHGDLRDTLLRAASEMVRETGIDGLSLRKLAEQVGVSRTAPYHHFKDKNELLCGIAEQGFRHWREQTNEILQDKSLALRERYRRFVKGYVHYAVENPELYDLMFGRRIWRDNTATQQLRDIAYPCFQDQVTMMKTWQQQGIMPTTESTLRLSQVTWATLHGIARLVIDGIYADTSHLDEMCECAVSLFMQSSSAP